MEINELQKALAVVKKVDRKATVSSYNTLYVGIFLNNLLIHDGNALDTTMSKLGWSAIRFNCGICICGGTRNKYRIIGWYK